MVNMETEIICISADDELTAKHDKIVQLYDAGVKVTEIAKQVNSTTSTVYRILRKPAVRAVLWELRAERLRPLLDKLYSELGKNIEVLTEMRDEKGAGPRQRISAVNELNMLLFRLVDMVEYKVQLAHLEAVLPPSTESTFDDE